MTKQTNISTFRKRLGKFLNGMYVFQFVLECITFLL